MSDQISTPWPTNVDSQTGDSHYEAAVQGYASRNPKLHEILARPGDYVEVFMCLGSVFGRHAYRVEADGKLRRVNGFRSTIRNGAGESMKLPPLWDQGVPKNDPNA